MFGQMFGAYLTKQKIISPEQFAQVECYQKNNRAKIGLIAVSEKMLTEADAEKINRVQAREDRRFGDIAVEKNLLSQKQVEILLGLQGSPYHSFMQALNEKDIISQEVANKALMDFQMDAGYTIPEMEALKNGDLDGILPLFIQTKDSFVGDLCGVAIRTILRLIDSDATLDLSYEVKEFSFSNLGVQTMIGDRDVFLGITGEEQGMLVIAQAFANEKFNQMNEDAFDSVCEFINCINGLFASTMSVNGIQVDMVPPTFYTAGCIKSNEKIMVVPVNFRGSMIFLLISLDNSVTIETI